MTRVEYEYDEWQVEADVIEERDGYGTGDSPTLYDVQFYSIIDEEGQPVDETSVSDRRYDALIDAAIEAYLGY